MFPTNEFTTCEIKIFYEKSLKIIILTIIIYRYYGLIRIYSGSSIYHKYILFHGN